MTKRFLHLLILGVSSIVSIVLPVFAQNNAGIDVDRCEPITTTNMNRVAEVASLNGVANDTYGSGLSWAPDEPVLAVTGLVDFMLYDLVSLEQQYFLSDNPWLVWDVAFNPDGTIIASATGDVRLWDVTTGDPRVLADLTHESDETAISIAFSPDGTTVATGSGGNGNIRIWDVETGEQLAIIERNNLRFGGQIAYSPDGTRLAAASLDNVLIVWDAQTLDTLLNEDFFGPVSDVAFSPDSQILAVVVQQRELYFWDAETLELILVPRELLAWTYTLAFSPSGELLAIGDEYNLHLFNVESLLEVGKSGASILSTEDATIYPYGTDATFSVAFSHDGKFIASKNSDDILRIWGVCETP